MTQAGESFRTISSAPLVPLLVFAHQQEARIFLERDRLTLLKEYHARPYKYYTNENYHLVITHGGAERSLFAVTELLSNSGSIDYSAVINLGFVGALSPTLKLGEVGVINITYGMYGIYEQKPFYESFTLKPQKIPTASNHNNLVSSTGESIIKNLYTSAQKHRYPLVSNLSVVKSPLQPKSKTKLFPFAQTVDQELWWIAYACNASIAFSSNSYIPTVPLSAIKVVSDTANETTKLSEITQRTPELALQLYKAFYTLMGTQGSLSKTAGFLASSKDNAAKLPNSIKKHPIKTSYQDTLNSFLEDKNFYFTASQKQILSELLKNLFNKKPTHQEWLTSLEKITSSLTPKKNAKLKKIKPSSITPKSRTAKLIRALQTLCYPQGSSYREKIMERIKDAQTKGFRIEVDPRLEQGEIGISFTVKNVNEWERYLETMPHKEVTELFRILGGEIPPTNIGNKNEKD